MARSSYNCESIKEPPEPQSSIDVKYLEQQRKLRLQDVINQKKLNNIQRNYVKCAIGKCPAIMSEHARRLNKLFQKKRKVNYLSTKKHDKELSRIFIDKGRKKRIEILQAEVNELDLKLNVASGKLHMKEIEDNYREIEENLRQQEDMDEQIKKAKIEIGHIKSQMERLDRKSIELDHETEAEVPFFEHFKRANRQLEIHENRLQHSRQHEGKMSAENKQLRELLCRMLYFRSIFNKHWSQIVDKLKNRKKFLLDMIERSSTAFSQDSDLMDNYKNLQSRRNRDRELGINEMLQMKRQIDANDIMDVFLGQKGKNRPPAPLEKKEVKRREDFKRIYDNRLNFYKLILDEMKNYPASSTDNPLQNTINYFTKVDDELFGYYRYQDTMNRRLDTVAVLVTNSTNEFNENFASVEKIQEYYKQTIKEREDTLQDEINKTIKCKMENGKLVREIERYSNGLFKIMKTLRCDLTSVEKLLRKHNIMDEHNLEIYLSILEQKMNEIIAFLYCKQRGIANIQDENSKFIVKSLKHAYYPVRKLNEIVATQQCPECAQSEDVNLQEADAAITILNDEEIREIMISKTQIPGLARRMHNLSACNLPRSGIIASRRYAK